MPDDGLVDLGGYPEIYSDGVGAVENLGVNARFLMFSWRQIDGVYKRCTVLSLIRPIPTLFDATRWIQIAMTKQPPGERAPLN